MQWHGAINTDNAQQLVVAVRVIEGKRYEFAGRGSSIAEAKTKAITLMWRQLRPTNGLSEEYVGKARTVNRLGQHQPA